MSFTIFVEATKQGNDRVGDLYFQLVGVVDIKSASVNYDDDLLYEFFMKDHPAKSFNLKPSLLKSVSPKENHAPFGIFLAAKSVNPQSDRQLISDELINDFKAKYPFVHLEESWKNWEDVLSFYK